MLFFNYLFFFQERLVPLEMPDKICGCQRSSIIAGQSIDVVTMNSKNFMDGVGVTFVDVAVPYTSHLHYSVSLSVTSMHM